jgi:hypothetical protein
MPLPKDLNKYRFNGPECKTDEDTKRLTGQIKRVYDLMADGAWRTLDEIHQATNDPHASISAQLRHLRKPRFGSHTVDRRARGDRSQGLYEYRLELTQRKLDEDHPMETDPNLIDCPRCKGKGTTIHRTNGSVEYCEKCFASGKVNKPIPRKPIPGGPAVEPVDPPIDFSDLEDDTGFLVNDPEAIMESLGDRDIAGADEHGFVARNPDQMKLI